MNQVGSFFAEHSIFIAAMACGINVGAVVLSWHSHVLWAKVFNGTALAISRA